MENNGCGDLIHASADPHSLDGFVMCRDIRAIECLVNWIG